MNQRAILASLLTLPVLALSAPAQPCPVTPYVPNYTASPMPSAFSSIVGAPGAVMVFGSGTDDDSSAPIVIPVAGFSLYGVPKTFFQINNNGFIAFDQFLGPCCFTAVAPGTPGTPEDYITAWWDDLHTGPSGSGLGSVWYQILASGDVVVEWNTMEAFPSGMGTENVTFQARFNASPADTIEFHYDQASFAPGAGIWAAVVGVEDALGAVGFDVTGLGSANSTFPATDFTLTFQPTGLPPQVSPGYNATSPPIGMTTISGTPGEVVVFSSAVPATCTTGCTTIFDDDFAGPISIPFPFKYFGESVTQFWIDTNGFVRFESAPFCGDFTNAAVGTTGSAGRAAPFWDDMKGSTTSTCRISYRLAGSAGSQAMTIEWKDLETWTGAMTCADNGTRLNFQLVFHEGTNDIEFKYGSMVFGTGPFPSGTIGVTNLAGTSGLDPTTLGPGNPFPSTQNYLFTPCCGYGLNFGTPCPSSASSGGSPAAGNPSFTVTQTGATPSVPGFLIIGLSNTFWTIPPPIPLPFPLATLGISGGCALRVSPDILIPVVNTSAGTTSVTIPIPPGLAACAATVYVQWANIAGGVPFSILMSDGLEVVTG